jgi:hypothetical protein
VIFVGEAAPSKSVMCSSDVLLTRD